MARVRVRVLVRVCRGRECMPWCRSTGAPSRRRAGARASALSPCRSRPPSRPPPSASSRSRASTAWTCSGSSSSARRTRPAAHHTRRSTCTATLWCQACPTNTQRPNSAWTTRVTQACAVRESNKHSHQIALVERINWENKYYTRIVNL